MLAERLYDSAAIDKRVRELARQIASDYDGRNPLIAGVLNSAAVFVADLTREMAIPLEYDFIALSPYGREEGVRFIKDLSTSIEGRHVIVVADTIDTGLTLRYVTATLKARQPASLATCVLLDRPQRRIAHVDVTYRGFEVPDVFVVGYGLDYLGRYRELPDLYIHGSWPQ